MSKPEVPGLEQYRTSAENFRNYSALLDCLDSQLMQIRQHHFPSSSSIVDASSLQVNNDQREGEQFDQYNHQGLYYQKKQQQKQHRVASSSLPLKSGYELYTDTDKSEIEAHIESQVTNNASMSSDSTTIPDSRTYQTHSLFNENLGSQSHQYSVGTVNTSVTIENDIPVRRRILHAERDVDKSSGDSVCPRPIPSTNDLCQQIITPQSEEHWSLLPNEQQPYIKPQRVSRNNAIKENLSKEESYIVLPNNISSINTASNVSPSSTIYKNEKCLKDGSYEPILDTSYIIRTNHPTKYNNQSSIAASHIAGKQSTCGERPNLPKDNKLTDLSPVKSNLKDCDININRQWEETTLRYNENRCDQNQKDVGVEQSQMKPFASGHYDNVLRQRTTHSANRTPCTSMHNKHKVFQNAEYASANPPNKYFGRVINSERQLMDPALTFPCAIRPVLNKKSSETMVDPNVMVKTQIELSAQENQIVITSTPIACLTGQRVVIKTQPGSRHLIKTRFPSENKTQFVIIDSPVFRQNICSKSQVNEDECFLSITRINHPADKSTQTYPIVKNESLNTYGNDDDCNLAAKGKTNSCDAVHHNAQKYEQGNCNSQESGNLVDINVHENDIKSVDRDFQISTATSCNSELDPHGVCVAALGSKTTVDSATNTAAPNLTSSDTYTTLFATKNRNEAPLRLTSVESLSDALCQLLNAITYKLSVSRRSVPSPLETKENKRTDKEPSDRSVTSNSLELLQRVIRSQNEARRALRDQDDMDAEVKTAPSEVNQGVTSISPDRRFSCYESDSVNSQASNSASSLNALSNRRIITNRWLFKDCNQTDDVVDADKDVCPKSNVRDAKGGCEPLKQSDSSELYGQKLDYTPSRIPSSSSLFCLSRQNSTSYSSAIDFPANAISNYKTSAACLPLNPQVVLPIYHPSNDKIKLCLLDEPKTNEISTSNDHITAAERNDNGSILKDNVLRNFDHDFFYRNAGVDGTSKMQLGTLIEKRNTHKNQQTKSVVTPSLSVQIRKEDPILTHNNIVGSSDESTEITFKSPDRTDVDLKRTISVNACNTELHENTIQSGNKARKRSTKSNQTISTLANLVEKQRCRLMATGVTNSVGGSGSGSGSTIGVYDSGETHKPFNKTKRYPRNSRYQPYGKRSPHSQQYNINMSHRTLLSQKSDLNNIKIDLLETFAFPDEYSVVTSPRKAALSQSCESFHIQPQIGSLNHCISEKSTAAERDDSDSNTNKEIYKMSFRNENSQTETHSIMISVSETQLLTAQTDTGATNLKPACSRLNKTESGNILTKSTNETATAGILSTSSNGLSSLVNEFPQARALPDNGFPLLPSHNLENNERVMIKQAIPDTTPAIVVDKNISKATIRSPKENAVYPRQSAQMTQPRLLRYRGTIWIIVYLFVIISLVIVFVYLVRHRWAPQNFRIYKPIVDHFYDMWS